MTTFPQSPLDLRLDFQLGGTWTSIASSYAYQRAGTSPPVKITRGRADETSQATASTSTWQLNNRDGRFSPRNPTGPYYGELGLGTVARWSVAAAATFLRLEDDSASCASCPDAAGLRITGDLDVRADVQLTTWTGGVIAAKWSFGGSSNSWIVNLNPDGTLTLFWSTTGSDLQSLTSSVPLIPQVTATARFCVRVTLDVSSASGHTATWYTGPAGGADGSTWTQLGAPVTGSGTTSIFAGTGTGLSCGTYFPPNIGGGMNGGIWEAEVRSGIGGTVVAHPVFSAQAAGATSFADALANTWTLSGTAELSARDYRFHGAMFLPSKWDSTGTDVWTQVTASGELRRMGQGQKTVQSPLRRGILAQQGILAPVAYWPMEDVTGSVSCASALGGPAMTAGAGVELASDSSSFACSLPLPSMNSGVMAGTVPAYVSNGSLIVRFLMSIQSAPANNSTIIRVAATGTVRALYCYFGTGGTLGIKGLDGSGASVFDSGFVSGMNGLSPVWVSLELRPAGGSTVNWSMATLEPGAAQATGFTGSYTGAIGNATALYPNALGQLGQATIGHMQVQSAWQSLFSLAAPLDAYDGEAAGTRFARLCSDNGIACRVVGPPAGTVAMGAQQSDTLLNLLQACEDCDQGQIFEPRQTFGLGYRTSASMCAQDPAVPLDYPSAHLGMSADDEGLTPADDDQYLKNDITVTRTGGSSFTASLDDESPRSTQVAGDYADSKDENLQSDAQLGSAANWRLHVGTTDEERYPTAPVNLARPELASLAAAVSAVDIGDYAVVTNPPAWLPPGQISQLVLGYTEELGGFFRQIRWNWVPESPYEVGLLDDPVYGRAGSSGSTLHAGITSSAASMQVDTTVFGSALWTTNPAHFPFDVALGGEQMTISGISGTSSPQTFTISARSVNGVVKAHQAGEAVALAHPMIIALAAAG